MTPLRRPTPALRRLGALVLAPLLTLGACGDELRPDDLPAGCRDEAWRAVFLASSDGGVVLDDGGQVVVALAAADVDATLDPYGVAPLAAVVAVPRVKPECVRSVAVTVTGLDGEDLAVTLPYDAGYRERYACPDLLRAGQQAVPVPVLGLYPDHANEVRVAVSEGGAVHTASLTITTGPIAAWLPTVVIAAAERDLMEPGWNLAGFRAGENGFKARPFVFDHHGRIRWVLLASAAVAPGFVTPFEPLRNGNLLLGFGDAVYEHSLLGREVSRWLLPEGFQQDHDVVEMPDGHLLVCGKSHGASIISGTGQELSPSDQVLEIDRATGEVRNVWDLRRFFDVDRYTFMKTGNGQDWLHLNAVVYDPADDSVIVSGKHQGIARITRGGVNVADPHAGKELRWILAPHLGWGRAGRDGTGPELAPYLLVAVDEAGTPFPDEMQDGTTSTPAFAWPYGQHAPLLLPDGSLFLFDNGDGRDLWRYPGEAFSRGVVYRVEPGVGAVGGTVRQVWQYGRERGAELFAPVLSDVDVGPATGNRFILPGSYTTRPDGTPGGVAKMVEVRPADGRVVFEAHILMRGDRAWGDDLCYRQERMALYFGAAP
ncbi:MAG: aryl-sulfate sulfotransferase [Deltaproteobacteria bacterium]|nr:aryl-sulfate sulfotransferase [Deltaproteobacteria bacterium]